ncbi:MAG: DUF1385 domain-containing protein [Fimbriimonadaceae bacterium]|nr:DUF1385 domain-containing protein [Fimbriimonadaceae bacterium]
MAEKPESFQFGGMAVLEGVMMRSPNFWAVSVRAPSGDILTKTEHVEKMWLFRQKWLQLPFLRGSLALLDTMFLGARAMRFAGEVAADERFLPESEKKLTEEERKKQKAKEQGLIGVTVLVSLALGVLIFDFAPEVVGTLTQTLFSFTGTQANAVVEVFKLALFLGYLLLIRRIPSILEVFKYHGAEHAAINAMEAGRPLEREEVTGCSRFHLRCGTNFAIMVILVGFLVFIPLPRDLFVPEGAPTVAALGIRMLVRLAVLPIIAGISYEIIRAAGRAKDKRLLTWVLTPGIWTQWITTETHEGKHAEVAIESLKAVEQAEAGGELINSDVDEVARRVQARLALEAGS